MGKSKILFFVFFLCVCGNVFTEQYVPQANNRVVINLGDTPWKFIKQDISGAESPSYNDSSWQDVGIPHCYNDMDTFLNVETGIGNTFMGTTWYRKHFTLDSQYSTRKIFILFEHVNIGCAVYVNGKFVPGNTKVSQPSGSKVTHVGGNISFVVDITTYVVFGGADNVLALRVANYGYWWRDIWYTPTIGSDFWCGGGQGGINAPVWLIITDKVHIPLNVYSVLEKWGTYLATPEVSQSQASFRMQTNVQNETDQTKSITLITEVVDKNNEVVLRLTSGPQNINPGQVYLFDQTGIISNPHLWYPNNCTYGEPYMYKVYSTVKDNGVTVDVFETPLGIRKVTWDNNFPYFNGNKVLLWGSALRQDYPALGHAVPVEQRWRDMKLLKDAGGNYIRPGHNAAMMAYVDACNHYGIAITQPCQDAEGNVGADPQLLTTDKEYKKEYLRDIIVRDRNNPSIISWEIANGSLPSGFPAELKTIIDTWDHLNRIGTTNKRLLADTNSDTSIDWNIAEVAGVMNAANGTKAAHPNTPVYTAELWYTGNGYCGRAFWSETYVEGYIHVVALDNNSNCFGGTHWTLWEYAGESRESLEGLKLRGGGWSMMDGTRIPKMTYYVYKNAAWVPFNIKPGVFIGGHWNRGTAGSTTTVKVWSNCPSVELFINGASQGIKTPNSWTVYPELQCSWNTTFQPGVIRAEGRNNQGNVVAVHEIRTAGNPARIELSLEEPIVKPDGTEFKIKANGSDCAFILAKVVDSDGNLCPTASNLITFSVSGPGSYRGGYNFYVYDGQPQSYRAPGDTSLFAEAGMIKIAVRSTFTPGTVLVTATSPGLTGGSVEFTTVPPVTQTGVPSKIILNAVPSTLPADNLSISTITAMICDDSNNLVPVAVSVRFSLTGQGQLLGTNPVTTQSGIATINYRAGSSEGTAIITATSQGLSNGSVQISLISNRAPSSPQNLKCANQTNPSGLTDFTPEFSWTFTDPDTGDFQSAYRILVSSDQALLSAGIGTSWDSGKVISSLSNAEYNGSALQSGGTYYWKVMTWDNYNSSGPYSSNAVFSMALNSPPNPPSNLKCNGVSNPMNLVDLNPELSWTFTDNDAGDYQTAFRLLISDNMSDLNANRGNILDTGKVISTESKIIYSGPLLQPGAVYNWKVMVWDKGDLASPYSSIATFNMAQVLARISVSTTALVFNEIKPGESKVLDFTITNTGSGVLSGNITTSDDWIQVVPESFYGNEITVNVTVDNEILYAREGEYEGVVSIHSNGGDVDVNVILTATCVLVKPNPVKIGQPVTFFGSGIVPDKTEIKIYTVNGEKINDALEYSKDGKEMIWDGRDEKGSYVIPGIYIYTYETPEEKGIGKFVVIK